MGEFFIRKSFLFYFVSVFFILSLSVAVFAAHPLYSDFSSAGSGFSFNRDNFRVSVSDTIIYNTGYFSVNGSSWQSFSLSGSSYNNDAHWISGFSTRTLPSFGMGEHYVIVYSCTYNSAISSWDCHEGKWQLIVFSVNETSTSNITINIPYELVISDVAPDCGDILDYQCGTRSICNENVNYGNCSRGYNCNNNLCVASENLTCSGVVCPSGEYCSRGVCLLNVSGNTYFVALWGDDSNPGTFERPFYHWQRAVEVSRPGDITYFRGGVWQPLERAENDINIGMSICGPESYNTAVSGTAQAPIRYYNYPGEKPIYDGQFIEPDENRWGSGIGLEIIEYIYLRGLTVRHIHQSPPDFSFTSKPYSEVFGIGSAGANIRYENIVSHDIDGRGFAHWSYAWGELDGPDAPFESDNTSWINCDAYNIYDRYSEEPGNAGDAWKVQGYYGNHFTWEGCRAFAYSDDGFDPSGQPFRVFDNCWAMASDKYQGLSFWNIEGNGYKSTGVDPQYVPDYQVGEEHFAIYKNCLAVGCNGPGGGVGFCNNILVDYDSLMPNGGLLYNNLAYKDGIGYSDANASVHRNNIVYESQQTEATGEPYEVYMYETQVDESHNTWMGRPRAGDWWWEYNPDYTVTDEDFVSLDVNQLMRPRKADGSLPDITFGHLKTGSDLIDGGIVIPGFHCSTVGAHPGQNCREWYGSAPDLGPFESNY